MYERCCWALRREMNSGVWVLCLTGAALGATLGAALDVALDVAQEAYILEPPLRLELFGHRGRGGRISELCKEIYPPWVFVDETVDLPVVEIIAVEAGKTDGAVEVFSIVSAQDALAILRVVADRSALDTLVETAPDRNIHIEPVRATDKAFRTVVAHSVVPLPPRILS